MPERLLIRHFLRRFLENDLVSPQSDRHESLATIAAAIGTSALFITVLLSLKYQFILQPPGHTSLFALDDRLLYIACSMIVTALAAVAQWDALALEARDASILGPLPIRHGAMVRAKVAAVGLFGLGFAVALNAVPALLHPWMLAGRLPLGVTGILMLSAAHAAITIAAGVFGFLCVFGLRELLYAFLPQVWFRRLGTVVQAALVVVLATAFLLVPSFSHGVAARHFSPPAALNSFAPPVWFLGLHEVMAGRVIDRLPRGQLRGPLLAAETRATARYRAIEFGGLAARAVTALALAAAVAGAAFVWNSRKLPVASFQRQRQPGWLAARLRRVAERTIVRRPAAQAGFFFTLQCLSRSAPHRLSMASAVGGGLAAGAVALRGVELGVRHDPSQVPVALLAIQTMLIVVVLAGFRHAIRVPAELRANWTFHVSWSGDERPYLAGARRAAHLVLVLPALLAIAPLHAAALGWPLALVHLLAGLLIASALLGALLLGFRKLPFACSYVPGGNLKALAPVYVLAAVALSYGLAVIERAAFSDARGLAAFIAALGVVALVLVAADRRQRRDRVPVDLDEPPPAATQRFSLGG